MDGRTGAQWLLCTFAFSLAFMQPPLFVGGYALVASDLLFSLLAGVIALLVIAGRVRLVGDRAFVSIALYFAAMLLSVVLGDGSASLSKLATQFVLFAMPVAACCLIRDEAALRRVVLAWLVGTGAVVLVGVASLLLFALDPAHPLLEWTRFQFGTLPPGPYPRLRLTFLNANMACNYLTVSFALLLAAGRVGWLGRRAAWLLGGGIVVVATTTISPGFAGFALLSGLWLWMRQRQTQPVLARLVLVAGLGVAALFVAAMAVTPILHPTAPYLIRVPGTDLILSPSPRLMIWTEAAANFLQHPLIGRGYGATAVSVSYLDPSGRLQQLTDAHNMFLNLAVQCGVVGLLALLALVAHMVRRTMPLRLTSDPAGIVRVAAGLGLLNGLVYQGLGGSFEDARHLWFLFGLLLASSRIEQRARAVVEGRGSGGLRLTPRGRGPLP